MTKIIEELKEIMSTGDWDDLNKFFYKTEVEINVHGYSVVPVSDINTKQYIGEYDFEWFNDPSNNTSTKILLADISSGRCNIRKLLRQIDFLELGVDINVNNMYDITLGEFKYIVSLIMSYRE